MTEEITTDHVRAQFARQENYTECYEGDLFLTPDGQCSAAEFDCWLAHVKAETLREAARDIEFDDDAVLLSHGEWLIARADQIESEASNE